MIRIKELPELNAYLSHGRTPGLQIGFVPTMGALHNGHLSLVNCSLKRDPISVVSIFVNPTQFNDPKDFTRYPRDIDKDLSLLHPLLRDKDVVFTPDAETVYPEPDTRQFDLAPLDSIMEGKFRPGHFNGVAQVVSRLFEMVKPDNAYFGSKDFQQVAVIQKLVDLLNLPVHIISCPVIREKDGLAMSSRNQLLTPEARKEAPVIYATLKMTAENAGKIPVSGLTEQVIHQVNQSTHLRVEYFEIVQRRTLQPVHSWTTPGQKQACIAVWADGIRLIDNITLPDE